MHECAGTTILLLLRAFNDGDWVAKRKLSQNHRLNTCGSDWVKGQKHVVWSGSKSKVSRLGQVMDQRHTVKIEPIVKLLDLVQMISCKVECSGVKCRCVV